MTSYTNIFGGQVLAPSFLNYVQFNMTGNLTLIWPTQFIDITPAGGTQYAAQITRVNPNAGGYTLTLPDATQTSVGQTILLINISNAHTVTVNDGGGNFLLTLAVSTGYYLYVSDNTTVAGMWGILSFGAASAVGVTSVNLTSSSPANLTVGGVPITTTGTITLTFGSDLAALIGFPAMGDTSTGFAMRTGVGAWSLFDLVGTANQISINTAGNDVTFSLPPTVIVATSVTAGNLKLDTDTITNITASDIIINSDAIIDENHLLKFGNSTNAFFVSLASSIPSSTINLVLPTTEPSAGQVLQVINGTSPWQFGWGNVTSFSGSSTDNAIARFNGTTGALQNSGIIISDTNAVTGMASLVISGGGGAINFNTVNNTIATATGGQNLNLTTETNSANVVISGLTYPNAAGVESTVLTANGVTTFVYSTNANKNLLANGAFDIWQRAALINNASFGYVNNTATYTSDRWILLSDGNNVVTHSQVSATTSAATYASIFALRQTVITANLKFGVAQILEANDSGQLLNELASISLVAKGVNINNIRVALLVWNDAGDPTTAIVAPGNWGAAGTNPTLSANWSYVLVSSNQAIIANFVRYKLNNITTSGSPGRIYAVFAWVDDVTAPNGATLDFTCFKLEQGPSATSFQPVEAAQELLLAKRWFQKDLPYPIAIGTTATQNANNRILGVAGTFADNTIYHMVRLPVEMRKTPSVVTYPVTTTTNVGRASDNTGTDLAAASANVSGIDTDSFSILNASGGAIVTTNYYQCHWYVEAGF